MSPEHPHPKIYTFVHIVRLWNPTHNNISVLKTLSLIVLRRRWVSKEISGELRQLPWKCTLSAKGEDVKFCIKEPQKSLPPFPWPQKKGGCSFAWTLRWASSEGSPKRFQRARDGGAGGRGRGEPEESQRWSTSKRVVGWRGRKARDWWLGTKSGPPSSRVAASVKMTFWG